MALQYISVSSSTTTASSYNFTGYSFGTESSDRYLIASVVGRASGTGLVVSSVTIGGVSATELIAHTIEDDGNSQPIGLYMALVPTGASGNVVVNFSGNALRASAALYSLTDMTNPTIYDGSANGGIQQLVSNSFFDVPASSYVISVAMQGASTNNPTWTFGDTAEDFGTQFQANGYHTGASSLVAVDEFTYSSAFRTDNTGIKNIATVVLVGEPSERVLYTDVLSYTFSSDSVPVSKTTTGVSRIQHVTSKTITGKASIRKEVAQTQTGRSRIQKVTTQTQLGKASILAVQAQEITGKSRIEKIISQTVTGKSRLQFTRTQTTTGRSRIVIAVDQVQTGKARILVVVSRTQAGKARVQFQTSRTTTGTARIQKSVSRTQVGQARIRKDVLQAITGTAAILHQFEQSITGTSRIGEAYPIPPVEGGGGYLKDEIPSGDITPTEADPTQGYLKDEIPEGDYASDSIDDSGVYRV